MSEDVILKRIRAGEGVSTEFKNDTRALTSIGRTVGAFLNSDGGQIYCGVADDGTILGIEGDAEAHAQALERDLKKLISPISLFTVDVASVNEKPVIVIEVPKGYDRPYVFKGAVYLRTEAQTITADAAALKVMVREQADTPVRWEKRTAPISDSDLDADEIRAAVRKVESTGRFTFTDRDDNLAVLADFALYQGGAFTNAADVLFSKRPTLRLPQCRVHLVQFAGDKADDVYKDNRPFEGPLSRVFSEALGALRAAIPIQSVFLPGEDRRIDQPAYDFQALGEGLVNAFVHRDYSAHSGGIRIQLFENRIEIWNSGRLPDGLSPYDLRHNHASILVNPDIANVFAAQDLMERLGRGTEKIVSASNALGARPPVWRDEPSGVTLTIFRAIQTESGVTVELNERQKRLLLDLQPGDSFTPRAYQERYAAALTPRQARRDLEELEALKWLVREGATRSTKYRLS